MSVKLLTEHHLEFLKLKGGCTGSSESTLVKLSHCWKSHCTAQLFIKIIIKSGNCMVMNAIQVCHTVFRYCPLIAISMNQSLKSHNLVRNEWFFVKIKLNMYHHGVVVLEQFY